MDINALVSGPIAAVTRKLATDAGLSRVDLEAVRKAVNSIQPGAVQLAAEEIPLPTRNPRRRPHFDRNRDGKVTAREIIAAVENNPGRYGLPEGKPIPESLKEKIKKLVEDYDENKDGGLDYREIVKAFRDRFPPPGPIPLPGRNPRR